MGREEEAAVSQQIHSSTRSAVLKKLCFAAAVVERCQLEMKAAAEALRVQPSAAAAELFRIEMAAAAGASRVHSAEAAAVHQQFATSVMMDSHRPLYQRAGLEPRQKPASPRWVAMEDLTSSVPIVEEQSAIRERLRSVTDIERLR